MSDIMTQLSPAGILGWILAEKEAQGSIFGVSKLFYATQDKTLPLFKEKLETPFGPAAGPHTQLAQNIIASYAAGSRFFELKTVQTLDGEDLPVSKPCIKAEDECYNVEWSTELYVPQALEEYIKGWFFCKLLAKEYGMGDPDGFIFNMSVGYDYDGIKSAKIDSYIEGMRNAEGTEIWQQCKQAALAQIDSFKNIDAGYIEAISPRVCESITLSTLHGCPPQEIERIASYLINEKKLNTYIKCNPTLLGYEYARKTLDSLGFDYIEFDDHHFKNDLQYADAVPMIKRLQQQADDMGVCFGVKLTNTFPVKIAQKELPGEEMYMSGRSLFPLTVSLAEQLTNEFGGKLRISYSGGADAFNIEQIYSAGIWPVTLATTLLKPGGYNRLQQMADALYAMPYAEWRGVDILAVGKLKQSAINSGYYKKSVKPLPNRKSGEAVPLLDCFTAPCSGGCPINQDIPAYIALAGEGRYLEALRVITEKNPLPFITGVICNHRCMDRCTRNFYEESVKIRDTKLLCANTAFSELLEELEAPEKTGESVAIIGGGAAGMAAAFFLARYGHPVTIFEKQERLGGIVRYVVPEFRVPANVVEQDEKLLRKMGANIITGKPAPSIDELKAQGFAHIILAVGAYKQGNIRLEQGEALNVLEFLTKSRAGTLSGLGRDVVVIGGGNTAMDAARAAKRSDGVENVRIVYRRTKRYMPADEEELVLAMEEGIEFMELLSPVAIQDGKLKCKVIKLGEADSSGRRSPVETDELAYVPASTVIAAVGEKVDDAFLKICGVELTERNGAIVDANLMTSVQGVYIAGDAQRGPATVVEAIADARAIADAIAGKSIEKTFEYSAVPESKRGVLISAIDAACEEERCLNCDLLCGNCVEVCPNRANIAIQANGTQILHIDKLCNECGNCEVFCPYQSAPYKHKFTLFASADDFENSENEGMLPLKKNKFRVRIDGDVYQCTIDGLPNGISEMAEAVINKYSYLMN